MDQKKESVNKKVIGGISITVSVLSVFLANHFFYYAPDVLPQLSKGTRRSILLLIVVVLTCLLSFILQKIWATFLSKRLLQNR